MKQKMLGKILWSIAPIFGVTSFYPPNKCKNCDKNKDLSCSSDFEKDKLEKEIKNNWTTDHGRQIIDHAVVCGQSSVVPFTS